MKIPLDLIEKAANDSPSGEELRRIRSRVATEGVLQLDGAERVERRKRMIASVTIENVADAFERYIGDNDLLPVNYLMMGYLQSRSVGLIRYFDKREGKGAVATGFLVSENLLVTNHHVFPVQNAAEFHAFARDATIEFNFEYDLDGNRPEPVLFALDPDQFLNTSRELDVAVVALRSTDKTGTKELKDQGYLVLNANLGKAGVGDFASIIQHPSGREKQIAIRQNEILNVDHPSSINYVSDTAQGSSGAPVFNDQWQVIALHSAGVAKKDANGRYLDKDGQVIEPVNGHIDEDFIVWESNRGIRVSSIVNHLLGGAVATHPLIQALASPAYTDSRPYAFLSRPTAISQPTTLVERSTTVSLPTAAPRVAFPPLTITVSIAPTAGGVSVIGSIPAPSAIDVEAFEKQFEDEFDYSDCAGFDDDFMGVRIPMPVPTAALRKKLATLGNSPSAYTLKYHHFSSIHHAVRRVPIVSAINVHAKYRYQELGKESRKDRWMRDNRIDYAVQLDDAFYKYSGFDKGHLVRREDAEWGTTMEKAKTAADLTCSYANAIPQVPALNQNMFGYKGRWGQLEQELLEKGVENESGKAGRICVFNGPLFKDDDPVFKGVPVALRFYKIVVWYDGDGQLRTTCFELSQVKLVGEIEFEVLRFNEIFKTNQVPISKIEKITGLTFHENITQNDTSSGEAEPVE